MVHYYFLLDSVADNAESSLSTLVLLGFLIFVTLKYSGICGDV